MKILVEDSTWNNVGDGWYQTSLFFLLKKLYPEHNVCLGEGPIRRAFRIRKRWQLDNALNLLDYESADVHVFSGPMMPSIIEDYGEAIRTLKNRGEQYLLLSASGTGLSSSKIASIGDFLKSYPPLLFSSRDEESYRNFSPYVQNSYNGICTAFLVDKTIKLERFELSKPFFISSFYTELEPTYSILGGNEASVENVIVKHRHKILGLPFRLCRHFDFLRSNKQSEVGGKFVVRTVQNLNTRFNHINFSMPNSFISFNPIKYLEVVKSSEFTISDRVHACAVSLACGHPARFLFNTPRAGIFSRMGFDSSKTGGVMYPNMQRIDDEMGLLEKKILETL